MQTKTSQCKHGVFTYHSEDRILGPALKIYGEYSEDEVLMYDTFLNYDDVAIEIGAYIGALTVPLSRRCKKVFAFEPQPESYTLLCMNLIQNNVLNVTAFPYAAGAKNEVVKISTIAEIDTALGDYMGVEIGSGGCLIEQHALDNMNFNDKINFIKMDCEGSELDTLKGAEKLITRYYPLIYTENNRPAKSLALVKWLKDHGYRCYWHRPPLYRENNYRKYIDNIFGDNGSINMICCHGIHKVVPGWMDEEVLV